MITIFDDLINELGLGPKIKKEKIRLFNKDIELDNLSKGILITGGEETGKTLLALDIIKDNKDKTFLYIDVLCSLNRPPEDNAFLLLGNDINYIIEFVRELDRDILDCVILDGLSYITSDEDDWTCESLRYEEVQKHIVNLLTLCASKNIMLIAFNHFNAKGTSSNISIKLKQQFQVIAELGESSIMEDNKIVLNINTTRDLLSNDLGKKFLTVNVPRDYI